MRELVLGIDILQKLVKEKNLVEGLCERELNSPEGCGFDLWLAKVFEISRKGFLGVEERKTPHGEVLKEYQEGVKDSIVLKPHDYYLTETVEKVNMPEDLFCLVKPRVTLHRMGIVYRGGVIDPGFFGTIHPAIFNAGPCEVEIEMGARYIHVIFLKVEGSAINYRGQWQGGRVAVEEREIQI